MEDSFHKTAIERACQISLEDPISDEFFNDVWCKSAADNTEIYERTFQCYPTDLVLIIFIKKINLNFIYLRFILLMNYLTGVQ